MGSAVLDSTMKYVMKQSPAIEYRVKTPLE
jgi:hypothetical protein